MIISHIFNIHSAQRMKYKMNATAFYVFSIFAMQQPATRVQGNSNSNKNKQQLKQTLFESLV